MGQLGVSLACKAFLVPASKAYGADGAPDRSTQKQRFARSTQRGDKDIRLKICCNDSPHRSRAQAFLTSLRTAFSLQHDLELLRMPQGVTSRAVQREQL